MSRSSNSTRLSNYAFHELHVNRDVHTSNSMRSWYGSADNEYHEDVSTNCKGALSLAFQITYVLILFSLITTVGAFIVFFKTQHDTAGNSMLSVQSITLFTGACDTNLHIYNLIAHLLINFFGTIVLAASNYLQQLCSNLSITDISNRLDKYKDFKFGSNSPGNVFQQKFSLKLLWLLLVITSLPLHVLINGIIGYAVSPIEASGRAVIPVQGVTPPIPTNWSSLSSDQCAQLLLHSLAYVTDFNNITIVVKPNTEPNVLDFYNTYMQDRDQRNVAYVAQASDITVCYVQVVESVCELTVRWFPAICAAGALVLKTIIVIVALHRHSHFRKRVFNSLGDIIAVGSRHRDLRTPRYPRDEGMFRGQPCPNRPFRIPWRRALGFWDVLVAVFWWISALGVTAYGIYAWQVIGTGLTFSDRLKRFAFGTVDPMTSLLPGSTDIRGGSPNTFPLQVVIANCPQLWLSISYLFWNNQITRIYMEGEWRSFYRNAQKPRISYGKAKGEVGVRETRWLQLPYTLSFVLIVLNTVLHWLVSQTLFVVEILGTAQDPTPNYYLNFSPLAIFITGAVATLLVLGMTIYYFIPIRTWMPLMAGSGRGGFEYCVKLEPTLPVAGIMWGDISTRTSRLAGFGEIAHELIPGAKYPGEIVAEPPHVRYRRSHLSYSGQSDMEPFLDGYQ